MNLSELKQYCQSLAVKENTGGIIKPEDFNKWLPVTVREVYNLFRKDYEKTKILSQAMSNYEVVLGDETMPHMSVSRYGKAVIPSDLEYLSSISYPFTDGVTTEYRPVIELTDAQFAVAESSELTKPTKYDPIVTIRQGYYDFRPKDLQKVKFVYLKKPENPYYDYYIDAYLNDIYLPPGTTYTLKAGEEGSKGQIIGTVTSTSIELIMHESAHTLIAYLILVKLGITIKDNQLIQYSELLIK